MKIDFSELKGLGSYTFKKDKGIRIEFVNGHKWETDAKDIFFMVKDEIGNILYASKKGCLECRDTSKYINVSKGWFPRYERFLCKQLNFKRDAKGFSKELACFREFCNNRRSGSEIYNLFFEELGNYIEVFDFKIIRI